MSVSQDGVVLTPENMADIETRHDRKAALLAEMRQEREAQYEQRNSHVGVEIGRGLAEHEYMASAHNSFLSMALYAQDRGKLAAAQTLRALALGVNRAAVEMYGKDHDLTYQRELEPLGFVEDRTPEQKAADGDGLEDIAAAIRASGEAGVWAEDDFEVIPSTEASISPEPDETPQRQAARMRRNAKAKASEG